MRGTPAERHLARLAPPVRDDVNRAVAAGEAVSSPEHAPLAVEVATGRLGALRRQGIVVAVVLAAGTAAVVALLADTLDEAGWVVAGAAAAAAAAAFVWWWRTAMLAPLERAVAANESLAQGGQAPHG